MILRFRSSGASLVEVLVALVVLAMGLAGAMSLLTSGIMLAREDLQARQITRLQSDREEWSLLRSHMTAALHEELAADLEQRLTNPEAATQ